MSGEIGIIKLFCSVYGLTNFYENLVLGAIKRKRPIAFIQDLKSISAFRLALFLATYSTLYQYFLSRLQSILNDRAERVKSAAEAESSIPNTVVLGFLTSKATAPFIASLISSLSFFIEPAGERRTSIVLSIFTKALQALWSVSGIDFINPTILASLIFSISQGILLHGFVYHPEEFPSGLGNFIMKYSTDYLPTSPKKVVEGIKVISQAHYPVNSTHQAAALVRGELKFVGEVLTSSMVGQENLMCSLIHPNERSCSLVARNFMKKEFIAAAKFFTLIALASATFKIKKTLASPAKALKSSLKSILTSSSFLSLSIGLSWSSICLLQSILPRTFLPTKRFFLQGALASSSVALTGLSRATDLADYSARLTIPFLFSVLEKKKKLVKIPGGEVLVFMFGISALVGILESGEERGEGKGRLEEGESAREKRAISSGFLRGALRRLIGKSWKE